MSPPIQPSVPPQKQRKGWDRLYYATGYSLAGLRAGWQEAAFRQEVALAIVLIPAAFWLGRNWVETSLLVGTVVAVMVVELLNSAIEAVVNRIGPEWHQLSKEAKDMGSAAVLLSLVVCAATWACALWQRLA